MKTLLLMRHAKSDWNSPELSDHQRPLNKRGRRAAPVMAKLLSERKLLPDLLISSDALRAQQTSTLVTESWEAPERLKLTRRLYLAEPSTYLEILTEVPVGTKSVMLVGHNPGISHLVRLLTGEDIELPTAAIVQIDLQVNEFAEADLGSAAELVGFWKPRDYDVVSS